jgi:phage/plasmid-like protein (TIGR03299 family)
VTSYTSRDPLHVDTTTDEGTLVGTVDAIGAETNFMSRDGRFPAFVGLAKATGGYYAENQQGMPIDQALLASGLDFTVSFAELRSDLGNGGEPVTYRQRGTVAQWPGGRRQAVGLGTVGPDYTLVQNEAVASLGEVIIDEGGASLVAAGAYGDPIGSRTYMAFKLPEGMTVAGADRHDLYLTLLNSHDGGGSLTGLLAPIRFFCTNQTEATFGKLANRIRLRHTGEMKVKIEEARRALRLAADWPSRYQREAERLLCTPLAGRDLDEFLEHVLPIPAGAGMQAIQNRERTRADVRELITVSDTNEFGRGTALAALNGVIEWADWGRRTQSTDPQQALQRRFVRTLDGGEGLEIKLTASRLLLALAA